MLAEEKRRADEVQVAQINADRARDRTKIQADRELALKEVKLKTQAQANTSAKVDPSPHNRDAKSPKLPAFVDEKYELQ